ncbi:unnamed protein product [Cunninghamella echinulata]
MKYNPPLPVEHIPKSFTIEPYLNEENLEHRLKVPSEDIPDSHHVILAHYDDTSILVYQAFSPQIADYAVQHQKFEGCPVYKLGRMTWIKPSFLWMQYRSRWNTKDDFQKRTLCIRLKRTYFDGLVNDSIKSNFKEGSSSIKTKEEWLEARKTSSVVVQWDPDYTPSLIPERIDTKRRAIQLGLKGKASCRLAKGINLEDIDKSDILSIEMLPPL